MSQSNRNYSRSLWPKKWIRAFWGSALATGLVSTAVLAQPPGVMVVRPDDKAAPSGGKPDSKPVKKVVMEFRDKSWKDVFDWYSTETGLAFVSGVKAPTGTVSFNTPKGESYTIAEVTDYLNSALLNQGMTLVRTDQKFFYLMDASEKPNDSLLPHVAPADLGSRGKYEVVQTVIKLTNLDAETLATELKPMMGPFGSRTAISAANTLILTDSARTLQRIYEMISEIEGTQSGTRDANLTYKCLYVKARDAEKLLREQMGDPQGMMKGMIQAQMQMQMQGMGGRGGPGGGNGNFPGGMAMAVPNQPKVKMFYISSDEKSNSVIVTGPPDKVAEAKRLLAEFDKGTRPLLPDTEPFIAYYDVPYGTADAVAGTLTHAYEGSKVVRIVAVGGRIMVFGSAQDHLDIAKQINTSAQPNMKMQLFDAGGQDLAKLETLLQGMFTDGKGGGPYIKAGESGIIAKGTPTQIAEVKAALDTLNAGAGGGSLRLINVDGGNAALLAEALNEMLRKMGRDSRLIVPDLKIAPEPAPKVEPKAAPTVPPKFTSPTGLLPRDINGTDVPPQDGVMIVSTQVPAAQPKPPQSGIVDPQKPAVSGPLITIQPVGPKLLVNTDDPALHQLVRELVTLLTANPNGGDFRVLKLKSANAAEAAKALDTWFNGTPQTGASTSPFGGNPFAAMFGGGGGGNPFDAGGRGGRGGFGGGGFGAPAAPAAALPGAASATAGGPTPGRIRVVAYPDTNALLIRSSALDFLTIQKLLAEAIDAQQDEGYLKTYTITLKHAKASDAASVIRDIFKDASATASVSVQQQAPVFQFGPQRTSNSNVLLKDQINISVYEQPNQLIISCSEAKYQAIEKLCKTLDESAKDSTQMVRVVPISGVDPLYVQQAIDAMQGRPINRNQNSGFGGRGGFGGGGFGGGGFPGGGFGGGFPGGGFGGGGGNPFGGGGGGNPFGGGGGGFGGGGGGRGGAGGGGGGPGGGGGGRGGAGGGRGGNRQPERPTSGGPSFFEQRVMDDQGSQLLQKLYDPAADRFSVAAEEPTRLNDIILDGGFHTGVPSMSSLVKQASVQMPAQPPKGANPPGETTPIVPPTVGDGNSVPIPRGSINIETISPLGIVIVTATNPADLAIALQVIKIIEDNAKKAEQTIEIVPIKHGDAANITGLLGTVIKTIQIGVSGNSVVQPTQSGGFGGFGGNQQQQQPQNVLLLALPRFNAILVGAPKVRMEDIKKEINKLDQPIPKSAQAVTFRLKKASAQTTATLLQSFYNERYPGEIGQNDQIRFIPDPDGNTIIVQAGPADMEEIRQLIESIDGSVSGAINDVRIVKIKNAIASDLADLLIRSLTPNVYQPTTTGTGFNFATGTQITGGSTTATGGGGGQQGGGQQGGGQQAGGANRATGANPFGGGTGTTGTSTGSAAATNTALTGITTKSTSLRFYTSTPGGVFESGLLSDVHLNADVRTNSLIIAAPTKTMDLLLALVRDLDTISALQANIKVFTLRKGNAVNTATLLQQLFTGLNSSSGNRAGGGTATGVTTFPGTGTGSAGGTSGSTSNINRPLLTLAGVTSDGANLLDLRIAVDDRTNSIIAAGAANDLDTIAAVIAKLEASINNERRDEVYTLRYAAAADVATTMTSYITAALQVYKDSNQFSAYDDFARNVAVIAEPVTNKLLISVTPQYYPSIMQLIQELDEPPEAVHISVLIAQVELTNDDEFGVEIGLQSPLFFNRSVQTGTATIGGTSPAVTATGAAVNSFAFNNVTQQPGTFTTVNNSNVIQQGVVGYQGLTNLGVGRANSSGVGGFVFSAGSDSVNILVRALKQQGRMDILNSPSLTTLNNQTAAVQVGQQYPTVSGSNISALGTVTPIITQTATGVNLKVTPRISPDGKILMRVEPSIVTPVATLISLGNGTNATAFDVQSIQTTVLASDGETVVLGGLISKSNIRNENKVPILGDLPGVGALFRYRTQSLIKNELIMILTPQIIHCDEEHRRLLVQQTALYNWNLKEVGKVYPYNNDKMRAAEAPVPPPLPPEKERHGLDKLFHRTPVQHQPTFAEEVDHALPLQPFGPEPMPAPSPTPIPPAPAPAPLAMPPSATRGQPILPPAIGGNPAAKEVPVSATSSLPPSASRSQPILPPTIGGEPAAKEAPASAISIPLLPAGGSN